MGYPTVAYPPWPSLDPAPDVLEDEAEYVQTAVAVLRDIFDEYHDIHQPERDALSYAKRHTYRAAHVLAEQTEGETPTVADLLDATDAFDRSRDLADERGVTDAEIPAAAVAYAEYANTVWRHDWAEDNVEMTPDAFIFIHDSVHELAEAHPDHQPPQTLAEIQAEEDTDE